MVKQLNLLKTGQIIPTALHLEMERSYLEYAMSVIVGRALPDVRDGLKPVHRRILYAMHELGLTPDRPYRKCARVVGDVLGKYHPHGDQAVYDALVRMVQDFSSRYPLLSGHGNFGSIDNDPPAAMRYTETRLAALATQGMLADISEAIVDFTPNFDNSQQEPVVLPAQLPILLLNGCSGIAVGMATNIPPHNLSELVDGLIALIDRPQITDEKLWEIIPAPDFPTGGEIIDLQGVHDAYRTGKGIIVVRGVTHIEKIYLGKRQTREKTAIVVTQLPYQVNKAGWIEKVADLVNQGRLEGIADLRDESDREGIRVVIELKRDAQASRVLQQLYKYTALQSNFGAIMLSLVDNQPRQLSLRQILNEFLQFREVTLTREYQNELQAKENRLHLLQGLTIALQNLDQLIEILRSAADGISAKGEMQTRLQMSETQADAVLAMPMRRLTALEREKLLAEARELNERIAVLKNLLSDRHQLLRALKKELRSLKRQFGDSRRTRILTEKPSEKSSPASITHSTLVARPTADSYITITRTGEVYWHNSPKPSKSSELTIFHTPVVPNQPLVVITAQGKAYPVEVANIPHQDAGAKQLLWRLLPKSVQKDRPTIVTQFFIPSKASEMLLLTQQGKAKKLMASELQGLSNRGLMLIKLKDKDSLAYLKWVEAQQNLAIATQSGRLLRYPLEAEQFPILGRNAQGITALRLRQGEDLVGCLAVKPTTEILLISALGYAKSLCLKELRQCRPGDLGSQKFAFSQPDDYLVAITPIQGEKIICLTNKQQQREIRLEQVAQKSKEAQPRRVLKLRNQEKIIAVYPQPC